MRLIDAVRGGWGRFKQNNANVQHTLAPMHFLWVDAIFLLCNCLVIRWWKWRRNADRLQRFCEDMVNEDVKNYQYNKKILTRLTGVPPVRNNRHAEVSGTDVESWLWFPRLARRWAVKIGGEQNVAYLLLGRRLVDQQALNGSGREVRSLREDNLVDALQGVGLEHPLTLEAELRLGQLRLSLGDGSHCIVQMFTLLERASRILPADHPVLLETTVDCLAAHYTKWVSPVNWPEPSREWTLELLQTCDEVFGRDHDIFLKLSSIAALAFPDPELISRAITRVGRAAQTTGAQFGMSSLPALALFRSLAELMNANSDSKGAAALLALVYESYVDVLGEDSKEALEVASMLAMIYLNTKEYHESLEWCIQANTILSRPAIHDYHVVSVAASVSFTVMMLTTEGRISLEKIAPMIDGFSYIANHLFRAIEITEVMARAQYNVPFERFLSHWFLICLHLNTPRVLEPIGALHGVDAWTDVLFGAPARPRFSQWGSKASRDFADACASLSRIRTLLLQLEEVSLSVEYAKRISRRAILREEERGAIDAYIQAKEVFQRENPEAPLAILSVYGVLRQFGARSRDHGLLLPVCVSENWFFYVFSNADETYNVFGMPGLSDLLLAIRSKLLSGSSSQTSVRGSVVLDASSPDKMSESAPSLDVLLAGAEAVWLEMENRFPATRRWTIVTGQGAHVIPFEYGRPAGMAATYFPGIPAFHRFHGDASSSVREGAPSPMVIIGTDDATESEFPLPFIATEVRCIQSILHRLNICCEHVEGTALLDEQDRQATFCHFAGHGQMSGPLDREHGVVVLDTRSSLNLCPSNVVALPRGLQEMYFSTCVGGIMGHTGFGGALGLPAALAGRGITTIASVAPIRDIYAPIVSALFYHARFSTTHGKIGSPEALNIVRHQLKSGKWPDAVVEVLTTEYHIAMQAVLERILECESSGDHTLALCLGRTVLSAWCFADDLHQTLANLSEEGGELAAVEQLLKYCGDRRTRDSIVETAVSRIIGERASPTARVAADFRYSIGFMMCWGPE